MTDGQAMKVAKRLDKMNWKMARLCDELEMHPNGATLLDDLRSQGWQNPSSAADILANHLEKPEQWEQVSCEWWHKAAVKAVSARAR